MNFGNQSRYTKLTQKVPKYAQRKAITINQL